jgi:hypothetical protein
MVHRTTEPGGGEDLQCLVEPCVLAAGHRCATSGATSRGACHGRRPNCGAGRPAWHAHGSVAAIVPGLRKGDAAPRMVGEAHVSSPLLEQVSRPIAVPEALRLVVQDKGLSVRGSAIFMPRQPPCDVEAGRIGPEHEHRPRPGRRGRSTIASHSFSECRADSSPRCAAQGHFAQQARSNSALRNHANHHAPALPLWCNALLREGSWWAGWRGSLDGMQRVRGSNPLSSTRHNASAGHPLRPLARVCQRITTSGD